MHQIYFHFSLLGQVQEKNLSQKRGIFSILKLLTKDLVLLDYLIILKHNYPFQETYLYALNLKLIKLSQKLQLLRKYQPQKVLPLRIFYVKQTLSISMGFKRLLKDPLTNIFHLDQWIVSKTLLNLQPLNFNFWKPKC